MEGPVDGSTKKSEYVPPPPLLFSRAGHYTQEHERYRERVRSFIRLHAREHLAAWRERGACAASVYRAAAQHGVYCMGVPCAYGGKGLGDFRYNQVVMEELAAAGAQDLLFVLGSDMVLPYFLRNTSEAQKQRWLPQIARGDGILAIAISEPHAGSDVAAIKTTAVEEGDSYVVNGEKFWISNGSIFDLMVLVCRTGDDRHRGVSLLVLEKEMAGITVIRKVQKVGLRGRDVCHIKLSNVRVPKANLLGREGMGFKYLMQNIPQERLSIAVDAVATAAVGLALTLSHAKKRTLFKRPLGQFQHNAFKLAEMQTSLELMQMFADRCVAQHNEGTLTSEMASMAKWWCTDQERIILDQCVQMHGGFGYLDSEDAAWSHAPVSIARLAVNARIHPVYGGANEVMKEMIAKKLGFPRL